jgi:putative transposase
MEQLINKSLKFRIYPNKETEQKFLQNIGSVRFVWNQLLDLREHDYKLIKERGGNPQFRKTYYNRRLTEFKQRYSFLNESDSTSLQSSFENQFTAFKNFFKGAGYPRYKSRKNPVQSFKIKSNGKDTKSIRFEGNQIRLNKHGFVQYKDNREIEGRILSATISLKNGKWYCAINCADVPVQTLNKTGLNLGIDLGIKNFLTLSNGEAISKPTTLKEEDKLIKLQRKLSRQQKGSNRWYKTLTKIHKSYDRINNIQNDFFHKLTINIVRNYDNICVETLKIKNMLKNRCLSHSIHNMSWYKFLIFLKYKCEWYGKNFIQINQWYPSSRLCSKCGYNKNDLSLNIRKWKCPSCGAIHDRDVNASINILNEGLNLLNRRCDGDSSIN